MSRLGSPATSARVNVGITVEKCTVTQRRLGKVPEHVVGTPQPQADGGLGLG